VQKKTIITMCHVAQQMSHCIKCNFLTIDGDFSHKFQILLAEGAFNDPCSLNIFTASRITAATNFILHFKIMPKNGESLRYLQRSNVFSVVKQFFSNHVLNVHLIFHISLMTFREAQCGLVESCSSW